MAAVKFCARDRVNSNKLKEPPTRVNRQARTRERERERKYVERYAFAFDGETRLRRNCPPMVKAC